MTAATPNMTEFAQQTLRISELVQLHFRKLRLEGAVPRVLQVRAPIVESTGGGKLARETIVLTPVDGDASTALVIAFVDVAMRSVEVKSHAALDSVYRQRHKVPLDLAKSDYANVVSELEKLLVEEGFVFRTVDEEEQAARVKAGERAGRFQVQGTLRWLALAVVVGAGLGILWYLTQR